MKLDETHKIKAKYYLTVFVCALILYFLILRIDAVSTWLSGVIDMLFPFILGIAIAFLLDKPMMFIERYVKKTKLKAKLCRTISAILALCFGLLVVVGFCALIAPQLWESILSLIEQAPSMINSFIKHTNNFMIEHDIDPNIFSSILSEEYFTGIVNNLTTQLTQTIPQLFAIGGKVTSLVFDVLIGLIAGLYVMLEKELFMRSLKSCTYAFLKKETADYLTRFANITARVFNDFIIGKAIDSLIIGILTYICMVVLKMPYALLLSTIVGVTNMIPVFGPFIGAVPGVFILTILNVKVGLTFALLILAIQQLDGNVIGPIILGDKLGLPSLAILFSVSIGGGLFGIVGMFIGVPIFAIVYIAVKEIVEEQLQKKNIELS